MQANLLTLKRLGIIEDTFHVFSSAIILKKRSKLEFLYTHKGTALAKETAGLNSHLIPSTTGLWIFGSIYPGIQNIFLFHSAIDALLFYQQRKIDLSNNVLIAMGLLISADQVARIIKSFPNALFNAVFGSDLWAHINACKIACFASKKHALFYLEEDKLKVVVDESAFFFDTQTFSFNQFKKVTRVRFKMRTHKLLNYENNRNLS